MKKTLSLIEKGFVSSSEETPEFKKFVSVFSSEFRNILKKKGASDIKIYSGHFYISGFFTFKEKYFYFSIGDVRCGSMRMMWRTAENYKDFTGVSNHFLSESVDMIEFMFEDIENYEKI